MTKLGYILRVFNCSRGFSKEDAGTQRPDMKRDRSSDLPDRAATPSELSTREVTIPIPDSHDDTQTSGVEAAETLEEVTLSQGVRDDGINGSENIFGGISPQFEAHGSDRPEIVSDQPPGVSEIHHAEDSERESVVSKRQKRSTPLHIGEDDKMTPQLDTFKAVEGGGPETQTLHARIQELEAKLSKVEHEKSLSSVESGSYVDSQANPILLQQAVESSRKAVGNYSRMVFQHLKASLKGEVGQVLLEDESDILFHRPAHVRLVLEASISAVMFVDFENESYVPGGPSLALDRHKRSELMMVSYRELADMEACGSESDLLHSYIASIETNEPLGRWGEAKWTAVQTMIGDMKCGNIWVVQTWNESSGGMQLAWVKMCYSLWALHTLAFAFHPSTEIIRVTKGEYFNTIFLELVDCCKDSDIPKETLAAKVAFMTQPAFRVRDTVVRGQVYPGWGKSPGGRRAAM